MEAKKVFTNTDNLNFKSNYFNMLLSWNSCYYMSPEDPFNFQKHVFEISRVLKKNGTIIISIPKKTCFIFKDSKKIKMTDDQKKLFGMEKLNIKKSEIPAVTHVDYSARIQTVNEKTNPKYFRLIKMFKEKTGCPVIVNTSFNVRGEPIVNTPKNAFNCFMGTELDNLAIGNCYLDKKEQNSNLKKDYLHNFELD